MVEKYLNQEKHMNSNITTYQEGIYKSQVSNIIEYNKQDEEAEIIINEKKDLNNQLQENKEEIKSQILNTNF